MVSYRYCSASIAVFAVRLDLLPAQLVAQAGRLYPVGRLDLESEGLFAGPQILGAWIIV